MSVNKSEIHNDIIKTFLNSMAKTASQHNLEKHMALISKTVEVYGVPGFEKIEYDDWFRQCEKEFEEKLIKEVGYEGIEILNSSESVIMFKTIEHIETSENVKNKSNVLIVITREDDGIWRVTQERVLPTEDLASAVNLNS